jgi:signal peptidase I
MGRTFTKEILVPIVLALVVIQFVIQAFKIPSASMEDSLLIGDFLLGLKFIYGSPIPFSDSKLPGLTDPKPGDVLIFRYPGDPAYPEGKPEKYRFMANLFLFGNLYWDRDPAPGLSHLVWYAPKDFIKRCVAQSGETIDVQGAKLMIDGKESALPPRGKFRADRGFDPLRDSLHFRLPMPGETLDMDTLSLKEAVWVRSLAYQENPGHKVELHLDVVKDSIVDSNYVMPYLNGDPRNPTHYAVYAFLNIRPREIDNGEQVYWSAENVPFSLVQEVARTGFTRTNDRAAFRAEPPGWRRVENNDYFMGNYLEVVNLNIMGQGQRAGHKYRIRPSLVVDGKIGTRYTVKKKCYFMMGDNRDNSSDSRYWGMLSKDFVKAKAFIIYFSLKDDENASAIHLRQPWTWLLIPTETRWSRIGKLIN